MHKTECLDFFKFQMNILYMVDNGHTFKDNIKDSKMRPGFVAQHNSVVDSLTVNLFYMYFSILQVLRESFLSHYIYKHLTELYWLAEDFYISMFISSYVGK